jgi:hypothetical protein
MIVARTEHSQKLLSRVSFNIFDPMFSVSALFALEHVISPSRPSIAQTNNDARHRRHVREPILGSGPVDSTYRIYPATNKSLDDFRIPLPNADDADMVR